MENKRKKIMFTAVWYPNRYDKMMGLFVRKHAAAVARLCDVFVVHTQPDTSLSLRHPFKLTENTFENVKEYSLYYHTTTIPLLKVPLNCLYFILAVAYLLRHAFRREGRPDITHVNVLTRWGVVAYTLKKIYGTPYVVTEHWTRYLPETNAYNGLIHKAVTRFVARHASRLMPVSKVLQQAMLSHNIKGNYTIVENVTDDFFFNPPAPREPDSKKTLLHVSCFYDKAKNISGIIDAVALLRQKRNDFQVVMVGTGMDYNSIVSKSEHAGLRDIIRFTGEITPEQVKEEMDKSDIFLFFSNYETAGVVFQETLACGKPWVSSHVGIAAEDPEGQYGITVEPGDTEGLAQAMSKMLDSYDRYSYDTLRNEGERYSFSTIGNRLNIIYDEALSSNGRH